MIKTAIRIGAKSVSEPTNLYCASCGRPEDASTVSYLGIKWCSICAKVRAISGGGRFVSQPSPGRMIGGENNDPLAAWEDCYLLEPKKRIIKSKAKAEIQRAWGLWEGDKSGNASMLLFFGWLRRFRPYFLTFRCKGDPWQQVHVWLLQVEHDR